MPNMISLQKFRLASTSGHVVNFEASIPGQEPKPVFVHPDAVREAMNRGCIPVDTAGIPVQDDTSKAKVEFRGTLRQSMLLMLMQRLVTENNAKNFDSGGAPRLDILSKLLGFDIDPKERKLVWQQFQTASSQGDDLVLHEHAKQVLDILDAQSKSDLLLVANELGVPHEEVAGLSLRDLRAKLLTRYSGLTNG